MDAGLVFPRTSLRVGCGGFQRSELARYFSEDRSTVPLHPLESAALSRRSPIPVIARHRSRGSVGWFCVIQGCHEPTVRGKGFGRTSRSVLPRPRVLHGCAPSPVSSAFACVPYVDVSPADHPRGSTRCGVADHRSTERGGDNRPTEARSQTAPLPPSARSSTTLTSPACQRSRSDSTICTRAL